MPNLNNLSLFVGLTVQGVVILVWRPRAADEPVTAHTPVQLLGRSSPL